MCSIDAGKLTLAFKAVGDFATGDVDPLECVLLLEGVLGVPTKSEEEIELEE